MRRPRLWLCLPPVVLCLLDGAVTLYGQPAAYWTGGYSTVREGNPLAAWLLTVHPLAFAASAVPYLFLVLTLICFLPRRGAVAVAILVSLAHILALAMWGFVLLTGVTTSLFHSTPLLARCAAAFARLPQTAMLHQRRAWAFVRSRNTSVQPE